MATPPPKISELYPWQDYEWYATDAEGHVAVFTSAGVGPIPSIVLANRATADSLAEAACNMESRGGATMLVRLPIPDDYIHFARCGFFAYDWQDVHRSLLFSRKYEMQSRPDNPIHVDEMPQQFRELLRVTKFGSVQFAKSRKIDVRKYFDCEPDA